MKDYYCAYNKNKEPIVIFQDIKDSINFLCTPKYLDIKIQRIEILPKLNEWYRIEQPKGKLIGYFLKQKDASEFLEGKFYSKKIFD